MTEYPESWVQLEDNPTLMDSAINEILRWSSTSAEVQRVLGRGVQIGAKLLRRGDSATLRNVSANRDERQFVDSWSFRIDRSPNRHLSTAVASTGAMVPCRAHRSLRPIQCLADRHVVFTLASEVRRVRSNFVPGFTTAPLTFTS